MSLAIKEIWAFELMGRMFASSGIGLVLVSPAGRFLDVNTTFCAKLGYSREQLLRMDASDLTHPEA